MKKFDFPLQKVLEYNAHMQKKEKDILAVMHAEYNELENQVISLKQSYANYIQKYLKKSIQGINITLVSFMLKYIKEIENKIQKVFKKMAEKQLQIDKQTQKLIEVSKEKVTVEKLRDSKYDKYKAVERKSEELFIEEFIAYTDSAINI